MSSVFCSTDDSSRYETLASLSTNIFLPILFSLPQGRGSSIFSSPLTLCVWVTGGRKFFHRSPEHTVSPVFLDLTALCGYFLQSWVPYVPQNNWKQPQRIRDIHLQASLTSMLWGSQELLSDHWSVQDTIVWNLCTTGSVLL